MILYSVFTEKQEQIKQSLHYYCMFDEAWTQGA